MVWKTASSLRWLARAAADSGAVSSPAPAAGLPSGQANVTMSEVEGGWRICCTRQGQAGMVRGKGAWAQPQRA